KKRRKTNKDTQPHFLLAAVFTFSCGFLETELKYRLEQPIKLSGYLLNSHFQQLHRTIVLIYIE
ncbi:hypothetical protein, partial [Bacillus amyloliquefaciens]|uniref:hypothetical protein n=1 Tax=Bacillus amyloliquefaciens TaxID=1390 RepID=UPI001C68EB2D